MVAEKAWATRSLLGRPGVLPTVPQDLPDFYLPQPRRLTLSYLPPHLLPAFNVFPLDPFPKTEPLSWFRAKRMHLGIRHVSSIPAPQPV